MTTTPVRETRSTCPYCGVGCGVVIASVDGQITGVRGDPDHPANFGRLCAKGSNLHLTATAPITRQARLLQPMRREHRGVAPRPMDWDKAGDFAATALHQIGPVHRGGAYGNAHFTGARSGRRGLFPAQVFPVDSDGFHFSYPRPFAAAYHDIRIFTPRS